MLALKFVWVDPPKLAILTARLWIIKFNDFN